MSDANDGKERSAASAARIQQMRQMVDRFPDDGRARYFLAHELFRAQDWSAAAEQLEVYLRLAPDDEGSGFKSYGLCLERLARPGDAAEAYRQGIEHAERHHHAGLAQEIRGLLSDLEEST
jgi:thioredoxin-like negative regulator of GroEL